MGNVGTEENEEGRPENSVNTSQHLSTDTGKTAYLVGGGHEMGMRTGCGDR